MCIVCCDTRSALNLRVGVGARSAHEHVLLGRAEEADGVVAERARTIPNADEAVSSERGVLTC